jgi:hypothetical protein
MEGQARLIRHHTLAASHGQTRTRADVFAGAIVSIMCSVATTVAHCADKERPPSWPCYDNPTKSVGIECVLEYQTAVSEDPSAHSERVWPWHLMHENVDLGPARRRWTTLVSGMAICTAERLQPTAPPAARGNLTQAHRRCFGTTRSVGLATCLAVAAATGPQVAQLSARIGQTNKAFPDHM